MNDKIMYTFDIYDNGLFITESDMYFESLAALYCHLNALEFIKGDYKIYSYSTLNDIIINEIKD